MFHKDTITLIIKTKKNTQTEGIEENWNKKMKKNEKIQYVGIEPVR